MPFDASKLKNIGADTIDALVQGFEAHAQVAAQEAKAALQLGAIKAKALAAEFAMGHLTFEQLGDFARKVGIAVETELAKIAVEQAKSYVRNVLDTLLGGALKILGAF